MADNRDTLLEKLGFNLDDITDEDFDLKASVDSFETTQKTKFESR